MITKIILGTVQFGMYYGIANKSGQPPDEQTIFKILNCARENGITTLDTADAYGSANEIIGKYHKTHPFFGVNGKFIAGKNNFELIRFCEKTLEQLGIPQINVLHFHRISDLLRFPELLEIMKELKREKKICKIGISVYSNEEMRTSIHNKEIEVIQFPFNLLDNYTLRGKLMKEAKEAGKALHARSVFLQGVLTMNGNRLPEKLASLRPYLQKLKKISEKYKINLPVMALHYVLFNKLIDAVVIGIDSLEQLRENIQHICALKANYKLMEEIDRIQVAEGPLLNPSNWK